MTARRLLRVGVVGAGYWGPNLVRNFHAHADTEVRWICDRDASRASALARRYPGVRTTTDVADVLSDDDVDAVVVATPPHTHAEIGLDALEAGKHVLVEKPLAPTLDEAEALVDAARRQGLTLMCDHTYCYTPAVRRIRELVRSGEIGDVQYVDSVRINLGLIQSQVDVLWDLAPHDLSILDFILPEDARPVEVSAHVADPVRVGQACVGYLTLPLHNDGIAHIHVNWLSPTKIRKTIVAGSRKMLVWDDLEPAQRLSIYDKGVETRETIADERRRDVLVSYRIGDMVAPALPEAEALQGVVNEFVDAIEQGRAPLTDGESGLRVVRTLAAAAKSIGSGGTLVPIDSGEVPR